VRIERILVVGVIGLIGTPVARQLLGDGHHVSLLARDPDRARTQLNDQTAAMLRLTRDPSPSFSMVVWTDASAWLMGTRDSAGRRNRRLSDLFDRPALSSKSAATRRRTPCLCGGRDVRTREAR
jgi:hypothetical protein